jgi:hypothetical protein
MSQRSQIEWLKFSRLRNKPLITCTDQCEYYCFHIFCSFLSFDSHGPSSGPYEIIVIFYFLSGNLMLVISWRKFGRRDQERRLAQSSGTSLRRGLTACVGQRQACCENDRLRNNTGATFSSWEEDVAKLCCLFLLNGNRISQQRFMPEDLVQVVET